MSTFQQRGLTNNFLQAKSPSTVQETRNSAYAYKPAQSSMEFESFDINREADDSAITVCSRDDPDPAADAGRPVLFLLLHSLCSVVCCLHCSLFLTSRMAPVL